MRERRPVYRGLLRDHDFPGKGPRVTCRHTHGVDVVWSARHGLKPYQEKGTR